MSLPSTQSSVVFWDFDGTLAQRDGLWAGALIDALASVDPAASVDNSRLRAELATGFPWHTPETTVGPLSADEWWRCLRPTFVRAFTAAGVHEELAKEASNRVGAEFYRVDAWELIEGAIDALTMTRTAGYRNVIVSNHGPELPRLVDSLGLSCLIDFTVTSAKIGAEKPHPLIFESAMSRADVSPADDVWMVGDNPTADVEGAERSGIRAILADGIYADAAGLTTLEAAHVIAASTNPVRE